MSAVFCAIALGIAWRNAFGVSERLAPVLCRAAGTMLRIGIALVGLRLTFAGIGEVAVSALAVVAGCIAVALGVSLAVGRALGLASPLSMLLAAGTAICGCTAIVAVTPVIRARPAETGIAMSCIVVLGCLGMFIYPWLARALFGADSGSAGVFLGTSIHDTSQVVAASMIYAQQFGAENVPAVAAFTKLLRNLSLLLLVPLLAFWSERSGRRGEGVPGELDRSQVFPAFLIWFVALAIARTLADGYFASGEPARLWHGALAIALTASELLLICGMVAVGLSVSLRDLRGVGSRAFLAALVVALAVAATSISLTFGVRQLLSAH